MQIILYSTNCPKCNVLKQKLTKKNIMFEEVNDIELIISKGFSAVPMLEIDGKSLNFVDANSLVNTF